MAAGEYAENVDVNKSITLEGEGADVVTVRAGDADDHVLEVTADWVTISGFTAMGATSSRNAGVYLGSGVDHCNISNNIVSDNYNGIHLSSSSNNTLIDNNVSDNCHGIYIESSSNNTLTYNDASDNNYGTYIPSSSHNLLTSNDASNNRNHGIHLWYSSNNNLTGNLMS